MAGITRIPSPSITDSLEAGITGGNTGRWCTAHLQHPEFLKAMQISRLGQSKLKRWLCAGDWDHIYKACTTVPGKGSMSAWQKQLFTTRCTCHCQQNAPPMHTAAFMPEAPQQHTPAAPTHSWGRDNKSCVITAAIGVGFPLWFNCPHDADTLHDELDRARGILHGFHKGDVWRVQGVKSCLCCSQSWQSLCKVCFTFVLLRHWAESCKPSYNTRAAARSPLTTAQPRRTFCLVKYPLNGLFTTLWFLERKLLSPFDSTV